MMYLFPFNTQQIQMLSRILNHQLKDQLNHNLTLLLQVRRAQHRWLGPLLPLPPARDLRPALHRVHPPQVRICGHSLVISVSVAVSECPSWAQPPCWRWCWWWCACSGGWQPRPASTQSPPPTLLCCNMWYLSIIISSIYIEVKKCAGVTKNRLFGNKMWFSVRIR